MDDDIGDEDVVFEGSSLHQHLLDTGYTDFEPSQLSHSSALRGNFTTYSAEETKTFLTPLREKWSLLCAAATGRWLRESLVRSGVSRVVAEAGLVSEDDWLLLDHFLPEGAQEYCSGHPCHHSVWSFCMQLTPVNSMWLIMVSLLMLGVGILAAGFEVWYCPVSALLFILPSFFFLTQGYIFLSCYHLIMQVKKVVMHLRDFSQIVSKSLRLLQEMDLIAKGFVLAQGSSSTRFSVEHESPQSFSLRDALTTGLKAVTPILFVNHHFLEQFTHLYPCTRHLFDDMPDMPECCNSTEYLLFLKKWVAVIKIQLSTLMTELLLSVHHQLGVHQLYIASHDVFSVRQASVVHNEAKSLSRHYEFTKVFLFEDRESRRAHKSVEDKKKDVFIAVHSLSLHMQAALFRIHNLERDFEGDNYARSEKDLVQEHKKLPTLEYVREQFDIIKRELESCQGCLEEAEARVDRKYGVDKVLSKQESLDPSISDIGEDIASAKTQKSVIVLSALEDPVIEDEVFEAYIDQEYSDRLNDAYDDNFWSADVKKERQVLKQQKEQGKRVLNELRPILVNRRKMWEKREEIALNKHLAKESQVHEKECSLDEENSLMLQQEEVVDETVRNTGTTDSPDQQEQVLTDHVTVDKIISVASIRNTELNDEQHCDCVEDEVDSDEERLEVYRKLRKELDEDEKRRLADEEEQESVFRINLQDLKPHQIMTKATSNVVSDAGYSLEDSPHQPFTEECLPVCVTNTGEGVPVYSGFQLDTRENVNQRNDIDACNKSKLNQNISVVKCPELTNTVPVRRKGIIPETTFSDSENDEADSIEYKDKPAPTEKEEIYEDGNDSADVECVRFSLPPHPTNTLAERMQLYSGGCGVGFHAEVAAQAIAASKLFRQAAPSAVEVFDGVGEGEEFCDDDDDDNDNDNKEEEEKK